jgi:hypothetical protein
MKEHRSGGTAPLISHLSARGGGWATPRSGRFTLCKESRYPEAGWAPRDCLYASGEEKISLPHWGSNPELSSKKQAAVPTVCPTALQIQYKNCLLVTLSGLIRSLASSDREAACCGICAAPT